MNKKVLQVAFVAAIALVSGINVFNAQKSEPLSDIALANVEALAEGEGSKECRWMRVQDDYGCVFLFTADAGIVHYHSGNEMRCHIQHDGNDNAIPQVMIIY